VLKKKKLKILSYFISILYFSWKLKLTYSWFLMCWRFLYKWK
jgi:hypothetical protein